MTELEVVIELDKNQAVMEANSHRVEDARRKRKYHTYKEDKSEPTKERSDDYYYVR